MLAPPPSLKRARDATTANCSEPQATQPAPSRNHKCSGAGPCWPGAPGNGGVARSDPSHASTRTKRTAPTSNGVTVTTRTEKVTQPANGLSGQAVKQARIEAVVPTGSHGAESCSTISVEDDDVRSTDSKDAAAALPASCSDKSAKHARATSARVHSMYVTCGAQKHFPLVSAVRYIYRTTVERYCGWVRPGNIRKVCARALEAIDEMLKGLYRCRLVPFAPQSWRRTAAYPPVPLCSNKKIASLTEICMIFCCKCTTSKKIITALNVQSSRREGSISCTVTRMHEQ